MNPIERYEAAVEQKAIQFDVVQAKAVERLTKLYNELIVYNSKRTSKAARLFGMLMGKQAPPRGLYFWGGVGRGKTFIMDTFFESLPFKEKKRIHFHRFMQQVHTALSANKGSKNPLDIISENMSKEFCVLCLDEFFVTDIGDAMILGGMLDGLLRNGVVLVTTSNIIPDGLYANGLQRERFLPAIHLLNEYTDVMNIDNGVDYRLRTLQKAELYFSPITEHAKVKMLMQFNALAPDADECTTNGSIEVLGRQIRFERECEDVIWFAFDALCGGPRSQNDYIEIAKCYHAVVVESVPVFDGLNDDAARRFINLVDEFYDRKVKLLVLAAQPITELYQGTQQSFEFERTESRLLEMQSEEYLSAQHLA